MSLAFREALARYDHLAEEQAAVLAAHYELLFRWNKVLNLTRIERLEDAVERHYGESLFVARHLPPGAWSIADIGSGAGFPGFPIAIVRPECTVTLIESHQRKATFLREAARAIGNIRVISRRAAEVDGHFDWVVSRAVSFTELGGSLQRLGSRAALLTGAEGPGAELGFVWDAPIRLPWGNNRFLFVSREDVSRET